MSAMKIPRVTSSPIFRKLAKHAPLSTADRAIITSMLAGRKTASAPGRLIPANETFYFIEEGWVAAEHISENGQRQIIAFLMPGDIIAAEPLPGLERMVRYRALTYLQLVDGASLREAARDTESHPGLSEALRLSGGQDRVQLYAAIIRLGRQQAVQRLASLLLELYRRLDEAGLATSKGAPMPLTQEMMADTLGLSTVHVNRTFGTLRRGKYLQLDRGMLRILNPEGLAHLAQSASLAKGD